MKQTAVEWLVEKLDQNFDYIADTIIEQAKAMEKEQIIKSCDFGRAFGYNQATGYPNPVSNPEQYYNETYKNTDK